MGITHAITDGVAEVVMDNPPVNALTVAGWFELAELVTRLGHDGTVRVVVLRAEGRGFNAGVDIKEMQATEGFDALLGANRGCFAAFAAVYECEVPVVAAVHGYCLGGGIGLMARRYGFAADHVTRLELVTVDGSLLTVSEHEEPDLFWALRGGGGSFGIVTALEMALMPVARLVGGGLMFDLGETPDVVSTWLHWTATMPSEMTSALTTMEVSKRHMAYVQIAYLGSAAEADELVAPLRALKPAYDGLQEIPYRRSITKNGTPVAPSAVAVCSSAVTSAPY